MKPTQPVVSGQGTHAQFQETRWTTVLAAIDPSASASNEALNKLCRTYWYPLYAFARRSGVSPHDAADLTQSFFSLLFEKSRLKGVDPAKGKFRSFLLASFKNFIHNEWDKQHAQKRGGGQEILSLDQDIAEERYQLEPAGHTSAEQLYDLQWAVTLINEVVEELRADYARAGESALFEALQPYLTGEIPDGRLAEIATSLGLNPSTLKSNLHRLRREEFGGRLRQQVRHTLANPTEQDVRDEIRHLFTVIGR
jgi:RNA polymerase sigma-70 factor (ECF subfamily)